MSEEEVPFKSIKITLSEEAIDMLTTLRLKGAFRSNSMTIEGCIRAIYEICGDIQTYLRFYRDKNEIVPNVEQLSAYKRYVLRLARFIEVEKPLKTKEAKASAGT